MSKYKICNYCHVAFDKRLDRCPSCRRKIPEYTPEIQEGTGRRYRTGGEACDYCPHCYGNENWCPLCD